MKIDPAAVFQVYNKGAGPARSPRQAGYSAGEPAQGEDRTDQVQISQEGARRAEAGQLTKAVTAKAPACAQRLEELRAAVRSGSYHVPAEKLADALIRRWFIA